MIYIKSPVLAFIVGCIIGLIIIISINYSARVYADVSIIENDGLAVSRTLNVTGLSKLIIVSDTVYNKVIVNVPQHEGDNFKVEFK